MITLILNNVNRPFVFTAPIKPKRLTLKQCHINLAWHRYTTTTGIELFRKTLGVVIRLKFLTNCTQMS